MGATAEFFSSRSVLNLKANKTKFFCILSAATPTMEKEKKVLHKEKKFLHLPLRVKY